VLRYTTTNKINTLEIIQNASSEEPCPQYGGHELLLAEALPLSQALKYWGLEHYPATITEVCNSKIE
jgi:hypothetical protein